MEVTREISANPIPDSDFMRLLERSGAHECEVRTLLTSQSRATAPDTLTPGALSVRVELTVEFIILSDPNEALEPFEQFLKDTVVKILLSSEPTKRN